MPPINIPLCAQLTMTGRVGQQVVSNVWTYKVQSGGVTAAKIDALVDWFFTTGYPQVRTVLPSAFSPDSITGRSVDPALVYENVRLATGLSTGTIPSDPINGEASPIIWKTANPAPAARGRTSFGPLTESNVNQDVLSSGLVSLLTALASFLISQHPGGSWSFAVGSRKFHFGNVITGAVIRALAGSLDSRLTRR